MSVQPTIQRPTVAVFPATVGALLCAICAIITVLCPFLMSNQHDAFGYTSISYFNGDFFDYMTIPMALLTIFVLSGFKVINPKEAVVLVLFGKFRGVMMDNGFFWVNPFVSASSVSLKIENFESAVVKVNDKTGSPIMISALVTTQVVDPEAYTFNADDPEDMVMNSIDRVLRRIVSQYPYDIVSKEKEGENSTELCLRDDSDEIKNQFKSEIQEILSKIGLEVLSASFASLAYAPEIAGVMLQRQQASAMMDARKMLVKSTVTVVKDAIKALESTEDSEVRISLDDKMKAELAANLLTVMVSERGAQVTLPLS